MSGISHNISKHLKENGINCAYQKGGGQFDHNECVAWNRQGRRRAEREIRQLIKTNDGCCSLCRVPFPCDGKVYGGIVTHGGAVLVGDCCEAKLDATGIVLQAKERTEGPPKK